MEKFLRVCQAIEVDLVPNRARNLRATIPKMLYETYLYLICGHDFIFFPSDNKFTGLVKVFIDPGGEFHVNLSSDCVEKIHEILQGKDIGVSVEGTSFFNNTSGNYVPGQQVNYKPTGGLRQGGVGNYNLQTKALEYSVNISGGLDHNNTFFSRQVGQFKLAFAAAPATASAITEHTLGEMRRALTPYWGGNLRSLGL